jgi:hypothetical protein
VEALQNIQRLESFDLFGAIVSVEIDHPDAAPL